MQEKKAVNTYLELRHKIERFQSETMKPVTVKKMQKNQLPAKTATAHQMRFASIQPRHPNHRGIGFSSRARSGVTSHVVTRSAALEKISRLTRRSHIARRWLITLRRFSFRPSTGRGLSGRATGRVNNGPRRELCGLLIAARGFS